MAIYTILCSGKGRFLPTPAASVFSLGDIRKITEQGVHFRNPINGDPIFLDPEKSMEIQYDLGSDIVMIFDECTPYPADWDYAKRSMEMSLRWAKRSRERFDSLETKMRCLVSFRAVFTKIYVIFLLKVW